MQIRLPWEGRKGYQMPTITRTYTVTSTVNIQMPIDGEWELTKALKDLGSHYMDAETRKYFGSRIATIWPTADGCVWTETTNGPRYGSQRWTYAKRLRIHSQEQIDAGAGTHEISQIYQDQGDLSPATAKRQATAAARAAVNG